MFIDLGSKSLLTHHHFSNGGSFGDSSSHLFSLLAVRQEQVELSDEHVLVVLEIAGSKDKDAIGEEVGFALLTGGESIFSKVETSSRDDLALGN